MDNNMLLLSMPQQYMDAQGISYFAQARPAHPGVQTDPRPPSPFDVHLLIKPTPGASDSGGLIRHISALVSRGREPVEGAKLRLVAQRLSPETDACFEIPTERRPAQMLGRPVQRYGSDLCLQPGTYRFEVSIGDSANAEFLAELH